MEFETISPTFFPFSFVISIRKKLGSETPLQDKIKIKLTISCYENTRNTTQPTSPAYSYEDVKCFSFLFY